MDEVTQEFFNQVPETGKKRLDNINIHFFVKKYFKPQEVETQQIHQLKNLLIRVEIRSYYYALDETKSTLSESAKQLLKNKEYVTFFNSCGQHYVRSVGSFSTYLALLQYRLTDNSTADQAFVSRLEKGLFNFSGDNNPKEEFTQDAEARGMRVYVQAVGLSKGNLVNLIPVDIKQFRLTVQDTVKLMQDPNAGVISYMEVVPWVENPELSSFMTSGMQKGGEQFIKLQRLEANSGLITEINRISNAQVEQFYIASMCEKILFESYMDETNRQFYENITMQKNKSSAITILRDIIKQKALSYDMEKTQFYNLANVSKDDVYVSLREFIEYFAKNPPKNLFDENKNYLYGDGNNPGAISCIDELYREGLEKVDYRTIPSCVKALKQITSQTFFLNQYCLPKPAKLVFKSDETEPSPQREEFRPKEIDTEIPNSEKPAGNIKGEKPKSLEELMGEKDKKDEKDMPPPKTEETNQKDERVKSLDDILNQGNSPPTSRPPEQKDSQPSSLILQEMEEGEREAKSNTPTQKEKEETSQSTSIERKTETRKPSEENDSQPTSLILQEMEEREAKSNTPTQKEMEERPQSTSIERKTETSKPSEEKVPEVKGKVLPKVENRSILSPEDEILKRDYEAPSFKKAW
ncbi:hypothetical protein KKA14_20510, partial [bacterium]|nr:hypothetical protein [bacterium]